MFLNLNKISSRGCEKLDIVLIIFIRKTSRQINLPWSIYQGVTRGRRRILVLLLSIKNMQEAWHCMNGGPPLRNDPVYDWFEKLDVWEIEIRVASGDNRTFITCIINLKSLKSSILYSFHHLFN